MLEKLHQATDVGSRRTSRIDDVAFPCDEESTREAAPFHTHSMVSRLRRGTNVNLEQ